MSRVCARSPVLVTLARLVSDLEHDRPSPLNREIPLVPKPNGMKTDSKVHASGRFMDHPSAALTAAASSPSAKCGGEFNSVTPFSQRWAPLGMPTGEQTPSGSPPGLRRREPAMQHRNTLGSAQLRARLQLVLVREDGHLQPAKPGMRLTAMRSGAGRH